MSKTHQPKTQELIDLIAANGWKDKFQKAFEKAKSYDVQEMDDNNSLDDYFDWLNMDVVIRMAIAVMVSVPLAGETIFLRPRVSWPARRRASVYS